MVRENGVKTYFASDIAYHLQQARARLRASALRLGRGSSRLHRAPARRPDRARRPAGMLRSAPGAVRLPVPRRREGADVDAFGRVRHLARFAQGSRQRCGAAVLRHAQQRSASGFRSGTRQGALQRQSGVLHPVRACARRERHAPAAGARARPRCARRPGVARAARRAAGDAADQALVRVSRKSSRSARCSARRTLWCITCATWPTISTPITARTNSSSRMRRCATRALCLALATQIVIRNGLRTAGRVRARDHVGEARRMARDYNARRNGGQSRRRLFRMGGPRCAASASGSRSPASFTSRIIGPTRRPRAAGKADKKKSRGDDAAGCGQRRCGRRGGLGEILRLLRHAAEIRSGGSGEGKGRPPGHSRRCPKRAAAPTCCRPARTRTSPTPIACARSSRCRGSNPRCRRCRSTTIPGIASASARSPNLDELNRLRAILRKADVDVLVIRVGD